MQQLEPARATIPLRFPLALPGGTIDAVHIDIDRPGRWGGDRPVISRITALSEDTLDRLAEHDYLRVLLKIEELNAPRLAAVEGF